MDISVFDGNQFSSLEKPAKRDTAIFALITIVFSHQQQCFNTSLVCVYLLVLILFFFNKYNKFLISKKLKPVELDRVSFFKYTYCQYLRCRHTAPAQYSAALEILLLRNSKERLDCTEPYPDSSKFRITIVLHFEQYSISKRVLF